MTRLAWFVAFFLFASLGAAFADSTPPDPIIDMEPGGDAVEFTGVFTFTITAADEQNCTNIGQFCFVELPTLENFLPNGQNITSVELSFDFPQGPFTVAQNADPNDFPNAIFTTESTVVQGVSELFTGSTIQPCQTVIIEGVPAQSEDDVPPCENQQTESFNIGIADAILNPATQSTTVTVTANVPEPSSAVLLLGGVAVLWTQRKRLLHQVHNAREKQQLNSLQT